MLAQRRPLDIFPSRACHKLTTRAFALDTGFWTCNDMPKRERSAAQARAEAVYRRANPDDKGDRGRDRRAEKVEYRRRLKKARAEAAALAVPDAAPAALVPVPNPSTVPRPRALGQHGRGHLLVARQPSLALPPPLAALPPTIAPRLVAPIPPLAPTASRYGGLALRDIAFGSSQGRLGKGGQGTVRLGRHYGGRLAVKQPLRMRDLTCCVTVHAKTQPRAQDSHCSHYREGENCVSP